MKCYFGDLVIILIILHPLVYAYPSRSPRNVPNHLDHASKLLKLFLKMAENVPLSENKPTLHTQPISYKIIDKTEFAANKEILTNVFESDIVMTEDQMLDVIGTFQQRVSKFFFFFFFSCYGNILFHFLFDGTNIRKKRKSIAGNSYRWANHTVPFVFRDSDPKWQLTIWLGMRKWEEETCIKFKQLHPQTHEKDYIYIFKGGGCYSSVGKIGGRQTASIGYGCESAGIVAHEMGHALGFWHEQNRDDRDEFINVNEDFILRGTKGNFEKRNDIDNTEDIPYDFGSVMHYGPQAFSNDYKYITVETKDHRYQHTIGQRSGLSFTDVKQANMMYCRNICPNNGLFCQNGGYQDPKNCLICKCPPGLTGDCTILAPSTPGCGGEVFALPTWQTLTSSIVGKCFWRLNAPTNQRIHFEVVHSSYSCDSSCSENFLEIKHTKNWQQTGFRQCCRAVPGTIISELNQVIIFSNSKSAPANFTIRYIIDSPTLPPPPLAPWEGDGLTSFLGGEIGIDNTLEHYIFNDFPKMFKRSKPSPDKPIDLLTPFVTSFLRSIKRNNK